MNVLHTDDTDVMDYFRFAAFWITAKKYKDSLVYVYLLVKLLHRVWIEPQRLEGTRRIVAR